MVQWVAGTPGGRGMLLMSPALPGVTGPLMPPHLLPPDAVCPGSTVVWLWVQRLAALSHDRG